MPPDASLQAAQSCSIGTGPETRSDELIARLAAERAEPQDRRMDLGAKRPLELVIARVLRAARDRDADRQPLEAPGQVEQEPQRGPVGPMHIVDGEDRGDVSARLTTSQ